MTVLSSHHALSSAVPAQKDRPPRVVAIGNFDGVHRGHQHIFGIVRTLATAAAGQAVVLTFSPHPARLLAPALAPPLITTAERKRELIAGCGIDVLIEEPFDAAFAALLPADFVKQVLIDGIGATHVCVGYDFTFGKGRAGNTAMLDQMLAERGAQLTVVPAFSVETPGVRAREHIVCSSSRVRQEVRGGQPQRAALILGRDFEIEGVVVPGAGRGRTIGVPTANLRPTTELLPATGVYAAWAEVLSNREVSSLHPAAVNVGYNPTFTSGGEGIPLSIEAHLLISKNAAALPSLYGVPLRLSLHARVREEKRFDSVSALVMQIREDVGAVTELLDVGR